MGSLRNRASLYAVAAAAATALIADHHAFATTGNWIGPSGGGWNTPANWSGGTPNAQGDTATYAANTTSSIAVNDVPGGVTVGTLKVTGTGNFSMQYTPNQNIIMNQDGNGPLSASWICDIQSTGMTGNPAIFLNNIGGGGVGTFVLQDDLLISNTSNSQRTTGSVQIRGPITGAGNIRIENVSNNIGVGQVAFTQSESGLGGGGQPLGWGGNTTIAKGAVTHSRGDCFTPGPGNFVIIGAAGMGDATLAFVGGSLGNIENNFVAAANTGGTNLYVGNATSGTGVDNIKSTNTNAAFVTLNGDLTFENRQSNGSILIVGDPVQGVGQITKTGPGPMEVTNTGTYEGGTIINTGSLRVRHADAINNGFGFYAATDGTLGSGDVKASTGTTFKLDTTSAGIDVIKNTAALVVDGTATADLGAGVNETVGGLSLGGVAQTANGTYGAIGSGAAHEDSHLTGSGFVTLQLGRSLYWDRNGTTAGTGAMPSGDWNGVTPNFNTQSDGGAGGTRSFATLATDPVIFSAGTDGTGSYAVNVTGTQNAASLSVARGTVAFSGGTIATPTFDVASGATATISSAVTGGTPGSVTKTGNGSLTITSNNTYTGGTTVQAGTLVVNRLHGLAANGTGTPNPVTITGGTLKVAHSAPAGSDPQSGNNAFISRPGSKPTITGTGLLDLTNNDLVVDYTNAQPSTPVDVENYVRSGYGPGQDWLGTTGITSSTAADDSNYMLGVANNGDLSAPFGDGTTGPLFFGQSVDDTTVLVKFTWHSDITLDGLVDSTDAVIFSTNYQEGQPAIWMFGDQDYDGVYTSTDAVVFATNYNEALTSLPEPGALSLLGLGLLGLARRRRQR